MQIVLIIGYIVFIGTSLIYAGLIIYEIWTEKRLNKKDWLLNLFKSIF